MPPSLFRGIIGHAGILRFLERSASNPTNAYLFYGPSHLGKRRIADTFVRALLEAPEDLDLRRHPDVAFLEPVEGKATVAIEAVRDARTRMSSRPSVGRRMVMYAQQADRLREDGMNVLLKVLEDPPAGGVFVFVAEEISAFPATVLSRTVRVPFYPVPLREITEGLIANGCPSDQAEERAIVSRGRPGLAVDDVRPDENLAKAFLNARSIGERFGIIEKLSAQCGSAEDQTDEWIRVCDEWGEVVRRNLADSPTTALVTAEALVTARRFVGGALSPRLPLEAAAVRLSTQMPLTRLFPSPISHPIPRIFSE